MSNDRRQIDKDIIQILEKSDKKLSDHIDSDNKIIIEIKDDISVLKRVIFGDDETGEVGMKHKVDEMYSILKNIEAFIKASSGIGSFIKWILLIGAGITAFKMWGAALVSFLVSSRL